MSRPSRLLCLLAVCLACPFPLFGQASPPPASSVASSPVVVKIGTVNIQQAISTTDEGKKELQALQQRFAPKEAELKKLNDELDALKKQLEAQGAKLSPEEQGNRARAIQTKEKNLKRQFDDAQGEYQQAEQEIVRRLYQKMVKVLEGFAKTNGYAVILDISDPQTPVLWRDASTEITANLVAAYNQTAATKTTGQAPPHTAGLATISVNTLP